MGRLAAIWQPKVPGVVIDALQQYQTIQLSPLQGQKQPIACPIALDDFVSTALEANHSAPVAADRSLVVQIRQTVVAEGQGGDASTGPGRIFSQTPGFENAIVLEQEVPVQFEMIVFQHCESWVGSICHYGQLPVSRGE